MLSLSLYCICLSSTFLPWHQSSGYLAAPACFWKNGVALKWRPFCSYMAAYIYKRLKTVLWNLQQLTHCSHLLSLGITDSRTFFFSTYQVVRSVKWQYFQTPGCISMRTTASTLLLLVLEGAYAPEYPCFLVHSSVPGRGWERVHINLWAISSFSRTAWEDLPNQISPGSTFHGSNTLCVKE